MVSEIIKKGISYYQCRECGFIYSSKDIAKRCEDFCIKYKGCSLEITRNAINVK